MKLLATQHVFITGGASGMGLGIADALAEYGLAVTLADIDQEQAEAAAGSRGDRCQAITLDVRNREAWADAKIQAEATFGPVDILVNNAGIGPDGKEFADVDPASFDQLIAVDLTGVLNGIFTFANAMRSRRAGAIVNNASMVGLVPGTPRLGPYTVAKAGVVAMSEVLRLELAPHGVQVSALCPGPVATDFETTSRREGGGTNYKSPAVARMNAFAVGRCVARGIERDDAYILTHPEYLFAAQKRADAIREAFLRQAE